MPRGFVLQHGRLRRHAERQDANLHSIRARAPRCFEVIRKHDVIGAVQNRPIYKILGSDPRSNPHFASRVYLGGAGCLGKDFKTGAIGERSTQDMLKVGEQHGGQCGKG